MVSASIAQGSLAQRGYHVTVCLKKCVSHLSVTFLLESERLFFISLFNVIFLQNLLFMFFFITFSDAVKSYFFHRTQDSLLLHLEIYKTKNVLLLIIFGDIFLDSHSG